MGVHGKVGEVETEPSLFQQIASGARAIRGSKEAILLIGLGGRVRIHLRSGGRPVRSDRRGVAGTRRTTPRGGCSPRPGIGGIVVVGTRGRQVRRAAPTPRPSSPSATFVAGIPLTMLAFVHEPVVAFLLLTIEGAAVIIADVVTTTTLQRVVPNDASGAPSASWAPSRSSAR